MGFYSISTEQEPNWEMKWKKVEREGKQNAGTKIKKWDWKGNEQEV